MGYVAVCKQDVSEVVLVRFNEIDQFRIHVAGVDQEGFTMLLGCDQIGVAKTNDGEVLINVQRRASS